jgi:hypothetical protein
MSLRPRCPLRSLTLRRSFVCLVALTGLVAGPSTALALEVDQVDVFNTSDTGQFGWTGGSGLSVEANGGPAGAGDAFLRVESFGTGMNSNKLVTHNQDQWTGNYLEAGVTGISMDVRNLGETPITLRIAMGNSSFPGPTDDLGDWMVSTVGISLPAMGAWTNVSFQLGADDFTGSYGAIMGSVLAMRIVNATTTAQPGKGDVVAAVLGVDNITALTSESSATSFQSRASPERTCNAGRATSAQTPAPTLMATTTATATTSSCGSATSARARASPRRSPRPNPRRES